MSESLLQTVPERLAALRAKMAEQKIDAYYINTADAHQSEYIAEYFQTRAWMTGFTGSAGFAVVTPTEAKLWADGRYYIQAAKQIEGSGFDLMKLGQKDTPTLQDYLRDVLPEGGRLAFDGRMVSLAQSERLQAALKERKPEFVSDVDFVGELWHDRPALPTAPLFVHDLEFTGLTAKEKIDNIRAKMKEDACDASLMVALDNIAWTVNLRGHDVSHTPVFLSFLLITPDQATLFVDPLKLSDEVKAHLSENEIDFVPYGGIDQALRDLKVAKLQLDPNRLSFYHSSLIPESVERHNCQAYAYLMKAQLNPTELQCTKRALLRDSATVTKYLHWVKEEVGREASDEYTAQMKLTAMRQDLDYFIEESFTTISAYGPNAAMMHYSASEESAAKLEAHGLYLCDCGSQFMDGTSDITRTIALGPITEEEKRDFTTTLKSHIHLVSTQFMEGTTGVILDGIARRPLWQIGFDYKCGTGHGVGYVLGVHEGPQGVSKRANLALRENMLVTVEPGVYKTDMHGIRLENDCIVVSRGEDPYQGDLYYGFEPLTFVPFDRDAIDPALLTADELQWLNAYHASCLEKLSPFFDDEERIWLRDACAPIEAPAAK